MRPIKTVALFVSAATAVFALFSASIDALPHHELWHLHTSSLAPLLSPENAEVIPDNYIVVLKNDLTEQQLERHRDRLSSILAQYGGLVEEGGENELRHVYDTKSVRGYAGKFTEEVIERIRATPEVDFVEHDSVIRTAALQTNAPWGLARITNRDALTFRNFNKYPHDSHAGTDVTAYILDTGINTKHLDFEGRAEWGVTIPKNVPDTDRNGHGTHVAGTVGGTRYGVAKKVKLVAVKVMDTDAGSMADLMSGVQWVVKRHKRASEKIKRSGKHKRYASVANISLGGSYSSACNKIVEDAVDEGIHFAVAAGNENYNACRKSPASSEKVMAVGASTIEDDRADFSNHGKCVDIFAPGKEITSAWIGSNIDTRTISGTSMASPHVCGIMAYMLSKVDEPQKVSPEELKKHIIHMASPNKLHNMPKDTPNRLAYMNPPDHLKGHKKNKQITFAKSFIDMFTITP